MSIVENELMSILKRAKETNYDFIARIRSAEHFNFKRYSIERGNLKKYDFLLKTVQKW